MEVELKIYRTKSNQSRNERMFYNTILYETESDKRLTSDRVKKIIRKAIPEYNDCSVIIETKEGWEARRSLQPSEKCPYHYEWEYIVILKQK